MEKVNTDGEYCRMEYDYIARNHKNPRMVPVVMDASMLCTEKWKGHFGFRWTGDPAWWDFSSSGKSDVEGLVRAIREAVMTKGNDWDSAKVTHIPLQQACIVSDFKAPPQHCCQGLPDVEPLFLFCLCQESS